MSELSHIPESTESKNQVRSLDTLLQVTPEEIPAECDPVKEPQNFYTWLVRGLERNGVGLMPADNAGLYEPTDLMVFCGFDATELQETGTFGDRRETWGMQGIELKSVAQQAETAGEWPMHSPIWYAKNNNKREEAPKIPALAVFDGEKMYRLGNHDRLRHDDEYGVAEGFLMDDAVVAVIYLPR